MHAHCFEKWVLESAPNCGACHANLINLKHFIPNQLPVNSVVDARGGEEVDHSLGWGISMILKASTCILGHPLNIVHFGIFSMTDGSDYQIKDSGATRMMERSDE
jgi:hypothetical protein